jgi:hypothetical protein
MALRFANAPRLLPPRSLVGNGVEVADAKKVAAKQPRLHTNINGLLDLSK